jgi:hypothetical protein
MRVSLLKVSSFVDFELRHIFPSSMKEKTSCISTNVGRYCCIWIQIIQKTEHENRLNCTRQGILQSLLRKPFNSTSHTWVFEIAHCQMERTVFPKSTGPRPRYSPEFETVVGYKALSTRIMSGYFGKARTVLQENCREYSQFAFIRQPVKHLNITSNPIFLGNTSASSPSQFYIPLHLEFSREEEIACCITSVLLHAPFEKTGSFPYMCTRIRQLKISAYHFGPSILCDMVKSSHSNGTRCIVVGV